jgi:hypothetical protein
MYSLMCDCKGGNKTKQGHESKQGTTREIEGKGEEEVRVG